MTSDETTEQAAHVIGSVMSRWDMDGRPDMDGGIDTLIARALDSAGLLAPAATRADIDGALINVTSNATNYPDPVQILGKDTGPLRSKCVDAICDLLGIQPDQATTKETQ